MKNIKGKSIFFGAVVVAIMMSSSAIAVTMQEEETINELESENIENGFNMENLNTKEFFSSTDLLLTFSDDTELERSMDIGDDPDELLGPFNLRIKISAKTLEGKYPKGIRGFCAGPSNFKVIEGTVNGINGPVQVSWIFLLGFHGFDMMRPLPGKFYAFGWALGLEIKK
jgi:hypothetical protein